MVVYSRVAYVGAVYIRQLLNIFDNVCVERLIDGMQHPTLFELQEYLCKSFYKMMNDESCSNQDISLIYFNEC